VATVTPQSQAQVDANFEAQLKALQAAAAAEATARPAGNQVVWMRPDPGQSGWNGGLDDWDALAGPFDRSQANQTVVTATSDAQQPGVVGDVIAGTTQAHYMATLERSFRLRQLSRCRAAVHAAARKQGQGDDRGTFVQCGLEYVRGLVAQSKASS